MKFILVHIFSFIFPDNSGDLVLAVDQYRVYWMIQDTSLLYSINKMTGDQLLEHRLPEPVKYVHAYNSMTQLLPGRYELRVM